MIDLHCHVLPGLDDGPQTVAESVEMCRMAAASGTGMIVATPHVSPQWPGNTPAVISTAVDQLRRTLAQEGIELAVVPGAEVALTILGQMSDDQLWEYHLGGGPWLLVECPHSPSTAGFDRILYSLLERNHRIVLAHPERSLAFHRDPAALAGFVRAGMLCSITAGSLSGRFGRTVQQYAQRLVRDGLVHNIASDGHNLTHRPPLATADVDLAGLFETTPEWYLDWVPRAILMGEEIPARDAERGPSIGDQRPQELERQISAAEGEIIKLRLEVARLQGESDRAIGQRDEASRQRDLAREERKRAEAWLMSVAGELEHLERELAARRAELARLEARQAGSDEQLEPGTIAG